MRFTSALLFLLVSCSSLKAQESYDYYTNYYALEAGFSGSSSGLNFGPSFSVFRSGHKIDVGIGVKFYDLWKDGQGILGSYLGYKYYPNLRKNSFNLYFGYHNIVSVHNKGERFPVIRDQASDTERFPTYAYLLENLIGMGFDYQMGNRFYMYSDFSVGALLHWTDYLERETQLEIQSTGLIRLGLGYNIAWKRAK